MIDPKPIARQWGTWLLALVSLGATAAVRPISTDGNRVLFGGNPRQRRRTQPVLEQHRLGR
ncbi:MAG: hypothetical protein KatS3mg121_1106 [Gammaproteobacteria bacterium]|nr:MAG: hypothetical protein KatS3mg121_1106 [Gammaproteobacteria bacterium]